MVERIADWPVFLSFFPPAIMETNAQKDFSTMIPSVTDAELMDYKSNCVPGYIRWRIWPLCK